jgi:hypothetical protein
MTITSKAVVLGGLFVASWSGTAEAAHYAKTVNMMCPSSQYCEATFPVVPAGKTLTISFASCYVMVSPGFNMSISAIGVSPLAPSTSFDAARAKHFLAWTANTGATFVGTMSQPVDVTITAGKAPAIYAGASGTTRAGTCAISGSLD